MPPRSPARGQSRQWSPESPRAPHSARLRAAALRRVPDGRPRWTFSAMERLAALDRPDLKEETRGRPPRSPGPARVLGAEGARPVRRPEVRRTCWPTIHLRLPLPPPSVRGVHSTLAAGDPNVLATQAETLYRTSGPASPIGSGAARLIPGRGRAGKQVGLRLGRAQSPRRTSRPTITWARALEEANVHVVYGLVGLKTHAKVTSVVTGSEGGRQHPALRANVGNPATTTPSTAHIV